MKNITQNSTLLSILLTVMLIQTSAFTTKNSELREFIIIIESTKTGLKLTGQKGTAFIELSFAIKENAPQGIDEYGMTIEETKTNDKDENLADFEFTIEKIDKRFILVGKKGTAWTTLNFDFSNKNKAIVDQYGVAVM